MAVISLLARTEAMPTPDEGWEHGLKNALCAGWRALMIK